MVTVIAATVRPFYTVESLAEYLSLSPRTVKDMIRSGELPSYKIGAARRIAADDVDAYLAERRSA